MGGVRAFTKSSFIPTYWRADACSCWCGRARLLEVGACASVCVTGDCVQNLIEAGKLMEEVGAPRVLEDQVGVEEVGAQLWGGLWPASGVGVTRKALGRLW